MLRAVYAVATSGGISSCDSPTTIFTQPWDGTDTGSASQTSADQTPTDFAKTYDDFSFVGGAIVTDVHWTGGFPPPVTETTVTSFTIEFFADSAGAPGASIQSATFLYAACNAASAGTVGSTPCFTYSVVLSTWFLAQPATTYWLKITANTSTAPPQWLWMDDGAGNAVLDFFGLGATPTGGAQAFDLTGCVGAPVTATYVLMEDGSYILMETGDKILLE